MNARQTIAAIEWVELNPRYEGDTRRMMRQERFSLLAAVGSGNAGTIGESLREAHRVAKMWGVNLETRR